MSKIAGGVAVVVVAVVAVVAGGWSGRQVDPFAARVARIANALDAHRDSGLLSLVEATGSGPEEKAVSRTDKNTFGVHRQRPRLGPRHPERRQHADHGAGDAEQQAVRPGRLPLVHRQPRLLVHGNGPPPVRRLHVRRRRRVRTEEYLFLAVATKVKR